MAVVNPMDKFLNSDEEVTWESFVDEIPEIKALVKDPTFEIVTVTRFGIWKAAGIVRLDLDVVAPRLLPHLRKNLINNGLIKECNIRGSSRDKDTGVEKILLAFFAGKLTMHLRVKKDTTTEFGPEKTLREIYFPSTEPSGVS